MADRPGHRPADDATLTALWVAHYGELVRVAALLLDEPSLAEDVVQEAYVRACTTGRALRDPEGGRAYLRTTVVNLARSNGRHRAVVRRHAQRHRVHRDEPSAEVVALDRLRAHAVMVALSRIGRRQREAVVLRYYGGLTEAETARVMGVSVGAVKSYCSRGLDALAVRLEEV